MGPEAFHIGLGYLFGQEKGPIIRPKKIRNENPFEK